MLGSNYHDYVCKVRNKQEHNRSYDLCDIGAVLLPTEL